MPKFFYIARDPTSKKIINSEEAFSQEDLLGRLHARNLTVINILPESTKTQAAFKVEAPVKKSAFRHSAIKSADLVLFCRQLATLLEAGVSIMKGLEIISNQVPSRKLHMVLKDLGRSMAEGLSFHEAMSKHPKVFSELWINLVESGEASGNLAIVLSRLASFLERREAFKSKIISSLMYPVILLSVGLGALLFLTVKIIPTFAELFKSFNITLPLLTRILMAISSILRKYFMLIIGAIIAIFFLFKKYVDTKDGRRRYEKFKFNLPVLGDFFNALVVERFSSGMSTLIESGVPIIYSLEITERSIGNLIVADIIRTVKDAVREGRPLSQPLAESNFFAPMVVQMIAVGEEIGDLPQMFKRLNTFYQEYVETFLSRITSMFEPLMLVFMGAVIGLMVIGMFLPIFQLSKIGGAGG